jgi:hypothetical protein
MDQRKGIEEPETRPHDIGERGTAVVIALFVMALIGGFVALAMTRTASEAASVGNESAETRTFYAAQGSLEMMTRNFNKIFETKLNPTLADRNNVMSAPVPGLSQTAGGQYRFNQVLQQTGPSTTNTLTGGPYAGLYALRDTWRLRTTATDVNSGTQVQLTRDVLNNRVPIFQFGVFYDDDLELFNGPQFGFGGRVHTNRHFFLHPSSNGAFFDSRVTAAGHIVTQVKKNGDTVNISSAYIRIKNASGVYKTLLPSEGSVLNGTPNVFASAPWTDPQLPSSAINPNWSSVTARFDGNIRSEVGELRLPLRVGANSDLIELIRRGKKAPAGSDGGDLANNAGTVQAVTSGPTGTADNLVLQAERFANKTGIRVSLADSKERLPGCATTMGTPVTGACGVRLDGHRIPGASGTAPISLTDPTLQNRSRGYQPLSMKLSSTDSGFNYTPTRVNGERLFTGGSRQVWIKIEMVSTDTSTQAIITRDITEDFLSLGVTEQAPAALGLASPYVSTPPNGSNLTSTTPQTASTGTDSRSVIKIQRFAIRGNTAIPNPPSPAPTVITYDGSNWNYVRLYTGVDAAKAAAGCDSGCTVSNTQPSGVSSFERYGHLKATTSGSGVVPFPVVMFDTREGLYFDEKSTTYYSNANFDNFRKLPRQGVMSIIDIDVANLRRFLRGDFDGLFRPTTNFPAGLRSTDIPSSMGWVLYVSDRRGDYDFDGELDMEDIYGAAPGNDGILQAGEDLDSITGTPGHGILENKTCFLGAIDCETERYADNAEYAARAAVANHRYFRRGVRLINGATLPGVYDSAVSSNTRGFTFASENGVYVQGNYNATGIGTVPTSGSSTSDQYLPFNQPTHIPGSVVGDSVTALSNAWNDTLSFSYPWDLGSRPASTTQMRFAMISGDTVTSAEGTPNQGGGDPRLNGGLHNFKRFLEDWGGERLDYTGSLINLYNSRNNNGAFKCCNTVYSPPRRNWVFDSSFLDPTRLPPGTPFFQYVQTTGFERTNS